MTPTATGSGVLEAALDEIRASLGDDAVLTGSDIDECVDPYVVVGRPHHGGSPA
jgi:hypothetical protein